MIITYNDLIDEIRDAKDVDAIVTCRLFDGTPFVFASKPATYELLRTHLSSNLAVPPDAITVVGSRRLGYSLNPSHPGRPMSEDSDIDVIVVNEALFDQVWSLLLGWRYPWHMRHWAESERDWGARHLENFFAGHCDPIRIRAAKRGSRRFRRDLLKLSHRWFSAFKSTAEHPDLAGYEFKGRLYRSWAFAIKYHAYGLRLLAENSPPHEPATP